MAHVPFLSMSFYAIIDFVSRRILKEELKHLIILPLFLNSNNSESQYPYGVFLIDKNVV